MPNIPEAGSPEDPLRVEASAEKQFFISMLTKDIELIPAIVDLVDNSVDGARALRGGDNDSFEGLRVHITATQEQFRISDNCGGIPLDVARNYAFRFGRAEGFHGIERSIGQFGVGMKRALFKLGQAFVVESATTDTRFRLAVNVADWAEADEWAFRFEEAEEDYHPADAGVAGTTITVEPLHEEIARDFGREGTIAALRADLQLRHQEALRNGLQVDVNGDVVVGRRPALLASDEVIPIRKTFVATRNGDRVDGEIFAGVVGSADDRDEGDAEQFTGDSEAGWYLFCNNRLVFAAERSRLTGWGYSAAAYHPQYRNFRGYVYLSADDSSLLPWNTTKTGVDEESFAFRAAQGEMFSSLRKVQAVINRAKTERQERPPDERPVSNAFAAAQPIPLNDLLASPNMGVPPPPPDPPPDTQRIQYVVGLERYEDVRAELGAGSAAEVGRETFDYFYSNQVQ